MNWVDILAIIILTLSFIGGLKEGALKTFFSLIIMVIAIPLAGLTYRYIAAVLSFLPGTDWENFLGFFIAMGIMSILLHLVSLIPRKIIQKIWEKGVLFRFLGGIINVLGAMIGMVVLALVLRAYPISTWLAVNFNNSSVLTALVDVFGFIQALMPDVFQRAVPMVTVLAGI